MKTRIPVTFLMLVATCCLHAQPAFQKLLYSKNFIGEPTIAPANNSDFIVSGTLLPNLSPAVVALLDKNGNTKWAKFYSDGVNSFDKPQIVQTNDSGYVLFASPTTNDPVLIKLDKTGNVLWSEFLTAAAGGLNGGFLTADGGNVLLTGRYGADQPVLIKINASNGNIVFAKALSIHPDGKRAYGGSSGVLTTSDNGYIICGYTSYTQNFQTYSYMIFAKFTGNGRFITAKVYNRNSELVSLVKANNGYIFTGNNNGNPCYIKADNKGNIVWSYQVGIGKSSDAVDIVRNAGGTYTFVVNNGSLANITEDGKLNWYKHANYKAALAFGGLCTTNDSGLIAISKDFFSKKDSCLLLKFDSNGNTCNGVSLKKFTADAITMQPATMLVDTSDVSNAFILQKGNFATVQMPFYNTDYCHAAPVAATGTQPNTTRLSITVSPDPVAGSVANVIIQHATAGTINITIARTDGRVVYNKSMLNNQATFTQPVDVHPLQPGVYTIKLMNGSLQAFATFIKQ